MEIQQRYRVNISTSVKGVKTWDCTVDIMRSMDEIEGGGMRFEFLREEILTESDKLVTELEKRYPITEVK